MYCHLEREIASKDSGLFDNQGATPAYMAWSVYVKKKKIANLSLAYAGHAAVAGGVDCWRLPYFSSETATEQIYQLQVTLLSDFLKQK